MSTIHFSKAFNGLMVFGLISLFIAQNLQAQSMEEGLKYYRQKEYQQAVGVFKQIKDARGSLFAGKSYYALGEYRQAQTSLNNISNSVSSRVYAEAGYTSALADFQQKNFSQSLLKLYNVQKMDVESSLSEQAHHLYEQLLNYLTAEQRIEAIKNLSEDEIKFDLLKSGLGRVAFKGARKLYETFNDHVDDKEWRQRSDKYKVTVGSLSAYKHEFGSRRKQLKPPKGTIYNVGVVLPSYDPQKTEFGIIKSLYFGILLAANQYNNHHDARVVVNFISSDHLEDHLKTFKNERYGDAIIGPLYSNRAEDMASLVTDLKLPAMAPLANDDIHTDGSYLFQANPTYKMHGKKMAEYAVNSLDINNFAIIANRSSKGKKSAESFREEAEKKGASVNYYYVRDLEANNYELADYVKQLGSGKQVEAIYAPFSGKESATLIDLLVSDLRKMSEIRTILGSQDYRNLNFNSSKYGGLQIYFSESTQKENNRLGSFKRAYHQKYDSYGSKYSVIGYDVAKCMLQALHQAGNPERLKQALTQSTYQGLLQNISFEGGNVNTAVKIMHITDTGKVVEKH